MDAKNIDENLLKKCEDTYNKLMDKNITTCGFCNATLFGSETSSCCCNYGKQILPQPHTIIQSDTPEGKALQTLYKKPDFPKYARRINHMLSFAQQSVQGTFII